MARTRRPLCCFVSPLRSKPSGDARRSSAACICCIGPHHRPGSGGSSSSCVLPCLAPNADHSVTTPLTSCCGSAEDVRGRAVARTPRTPTARRLCGVRSRTPRRGGAAAAAAASAGAAAAARTPRTPATPIGRSQQRACCVRGPAQQQGSAKTTTGGTRRRWLRSARHTLAQTPRKAARAVAGSGTRDVTPRANGGRDIRTPHGGNGGDVVVVNKVYGTRPAEPVGEATKEPEVESSTCSNDEYALLCRVGFAREDVAAVTIQAYFRAHLARRAFKALKSLVRLQAVARGGYVRRQAEVAVSCMQAMSRLQERVRARQMLNSMPKEEKLQLLPS